MRNLYQLWDLFMYIMYLYVDVCMWMYIGVCMYHVYHVYVCGHKTPATYASLGYLGLPAPTGIHGNMV
jgi:hypothetical protein